MIRINYVTVTLCITKGGHKKSMFQFDWKPRTSKRDIFERPFVKRFALCYHWHAGRPRPWRYCIRWGPSSPPPKGHSPHPMFGPFILWPNGCMHQDAAGYGGSPQPRGLCVRWGPTLNFWPMFIIVIVISLEHCTGVRHYWFVQVQVKF